MLIVVELWRRAVAQRTLGFFSCMVLQQLVKMCAEKQQDGTYLKHLEAYDNLGPIMDFCLVDPDNQGQHHVGALLPAKRSRLKAHTPFTRAET